MLLTASNVSPVRSWERSANTLLHVGGQGQQEGQKGEGKRERQGKGESKGKGEGKGESKEKEDDKKDIKKCLQFQHWQAVKIFTPVLSDICTGSNVGRNVLCWKFMEIQLCPTLMDISVTLPQPYAPFARLFVSLGLTTWQLLSWPRASTWRRKLWPPLWLSQLSKARNQKHSKTHRNHMKSHELTLNKKGNRTHLQLSAGQIDALDRIHKYCGVALLTYFLTYWQLLWQVKWALPFPLPLPLQRPSLAPWWPVAWDVSVAACQRQGYSDEHRPWIS